MDSLSVDLVLRILNLTFLNPLFSVWVPILTLSQVSLSSFTVIIYQRGTDQPARWPAIHDFIYTLQGIAVLCSRNSRSRVVKLPGWSLHLQALAYFEYAAFLGLGRTGAQMGRADCVGYGGSEWGGASPGRNAANDAGHCRSD